MASGLAAGFLSAQLAAVKQKESEDLELDEAALFDDDDDQDDAEEGEEAQAAAGASFAPHQGASHDAGPPSAGKGDHSVGESEFSSSDEEEQLEDLDAALEDVAVARSSSINASSGGGLGDSFPGATKMLPDNSISIAAPGVPSWGELPNSRKFQFHAPPHAVPASLPISAGGIRRQLRPISELSINTANTRGYTTESKMGTSVPVAIPSAVRRKMAQQGLGQTGADEGMRAATFVPPHQLMAQMVGHGDKFSLGVSTMGISPSTSLKRDRLVQRNAILRRTGFIEGSRGAPFLETMNPIKEIIEPGSSYGLSSALSAALSTSFPRNG